MNLSSSLGTMNINAMAHFWTCKAFLPSMCQRNHGHIVSIASLAGKVFLNFIRYESLYTNTYFYCSHTGNVGVNKLTDYSASKFCAVGFEEALRLELFANNYDGVKSTIVSPW